MWVYVLCGLSSSRYAGGGGALAWPGTQPARWCCRVLLSVEVWRGADMANAAMHVCNMLSVPVR